VTGWVMTGWDIVASAGILLLGVPHGGLDGAVARRIGWPAGLIPWLGFHIAYVALAALVAVIWWYFPLPSLAVFLAVSALHFGASDIADVKNKSGTNASAHWLPWAAHAGLVCIAIPSLQPTLVEPIFAILVGTANADQLMTGLTNLFLPWAISFVAYGAFAYRQPQYRKSLLSLVILIGLVILLPPLISFALYFCLWHSRGHMLRLWRSLAETERQCSLREATIYSVMAWLSGAVIFYYLPGFLATSSPLTQTNLASASMVQLTFIGLAALTLPHMLLVDYADRLRHQREQNP